MERRSARRTAALFLLRLLCSVLYERLTVRCNHSALEDDGETADHGDQALEPLFMDLQQVVKSPTCRDIEIFRQRLGSKVENLGKHQQARGQDCQSAPYPPPRPLPKEVAQRTGSKPADQQQDRHGDQPAGKLFDKRRIRYSVFQCQTLGLC